MRKSALIKAIKNIFRNFLMSFASVVSVAFTLTMLGLVLLSLVNLQYMVNRLEQRFDTITYAVDKEAAEDDIISLEDSIEEIPNVVEVQRVTKEEAFELMREELGRALDGMEDNPLFDTFRIKIEPVSEADNVIANLDNLGDSDRIYYDREVAEIIISASRLIRNVGAVLVVALLFITILSIVNTIRVGISSHEKEITIMRYVGGTRGYIRGPFLIEGLILGLIGSLVSAVVVFFSYQKLQQVVGVYLAQMTSEIFINDPKLIYQVIIVNVVIGMSVGLFGSLFSMRRHLKV